MSLKRYYSDNAYVPSGVTDVLPRPLSKRRRAIETRNAPETIDLTNDTDDEDIDVEFVDAQHQLDLFVWTQETLNLEDDVESITGSDSDNDSQLTIPLPDNLFRSIARAQDEESIMDSDSDNDM